MEKSCAASSFFGEISEVARDHLIYISSQQIFLTRRFDNFNVRLSYNFESPTNILDWVGLYQVDEKNALRYLVYAPIKCSQMSHNLNINLKYDTIFGPSSPVSISTFCFRYYGINGAVRATSPQFVIYSHAQIIVHKIFLTGLPSKVHNTFVKVKSGSYGYRTLTGEQNCTNWEDLNFEFPVDCSKELSIELKEEILWSKDKVLGKTNISMLDLVHSAKNRNYFTFSNVLRKEQQSSPKLNKSEHLNSTDSIIISLTVQVIPTNSATITSTNKQVMTDAHTNLLQNNNNENGIATPAISLPPKQYPFKGTLKDWQKSGSKISEMNNHFKNMGLEKRNIMNSSQSSSVSSGVSSLSDTSKSSSANFDSLPEGYEARLDNEGRIFYIDHINRKTTWNLPYIEQVTASSSSASSTSSSITSSLQSSANKVNLEEISYNYNRRTTVKSCLETNLLPSIAFLKRNDFAHVLQNNSNGLSLYNKSPYLKHMIQRIRKCEDNFDKFSKNIEMINFINAFADTTQPLPNGWQELRNQGNESFFANHISKSITPIDPRLPLELKKRTRSAPPINRNKKGGTTSQGPSTMAALIDKIEDIKVLVRTNYPDSAYRICKKLSLIAKIGESALLRFANDIDIISAISLFEQTQANGQSEDVPEDTTNNNNNELEDSDGGEFRDKVSYFYASINRAGYGQSPTKIKLLLRRFFLVEDSFQKIMSIDGMQLRKSQFTVSFEDEDGLDYGGPSRELFYLLSRDLFNPHFKLFEYSSGGVYTVTVSPKATEVSDYVRWFELCGRVLGLALIHRCLIDSFFPKPFYKILLGHSYLLDDLKEMDPLYWKSLNWISTNIITPDMDFTFTVTETVDNKVVDKELLVGGSNIKVTEYNKEEYIQCLLKWRIERGISKQIKALLRGLNDVIERDYLRVFDAAQLELMLSGTMEINLEDWRENCDYKGGYFDQHVVITWFWNTVYEMTNAERLKLLQFITGTASIPYEGFIGLRGSNGPKKFTIERWGESSSLPRAHTCFNRLDLPMYRDSKSLKEKLLLAINESSSYAIE